jgi:hypothetical protein
MIEKTNMNNFDTALIGMQRASKTLKITLPGVYLTRGGDFLNPEISSIHKSKKH